MIYGCIHFDSRFQCAIPHITTSAQCKYHFLHSETVLALCSDTSWKKLSNSLSCKKKKQFSTEKKQFSCTHEQPISCVLISRHLDFRSTGSVKSFLSAFLFIFIFPHDCQFCRETEMLWIQSVFRAKHLLAPAVLRPQVTGFLTVRRKEDEDALNKN